MADPMKDLEELDTINAERVAAGLAEVSSIAEAREWKAKQGEVKPDENAEPAKAAEPQPIDDAPTQAEPVKFTAPVAKRAEAKSDDGELAAAKAEIQRLKSEAGRSTVLANELRDLKARAEEAERRAQDAEQKAEEAMQKASGGGMFSFLTDEQRDTMTPEAIAAIERGVTQYVNKALAAVEAKAGSGVSEVRAALEQRQALEAQREQRERQERANVMWSKVVAPVVPPEVYGQFASHPKWDEWCNRTYAGQYNADLYTQAVENADGEAVIDQLQRFMRFAKIEIPAKGQKPPLRVEESRGGSAPTITDTYAEKRYRYDDINAINQRFVKGQGLPSGWTMKDFTAWSERMEQAQAEGRVVDAAGNPVYDKPL